MRDVKSDNLKIDYFDKKRPTFKESIISTAVIESANKSLKNNSNWEIINAMV